MNTLYARLWSRFARNTLIVGIILVILWAIGNIFVPEGAWMVAVNIGFVVLSLLFFWLPMDRCLTMVLPKWFAFLVTSLLWVVLFFGLRSLILSLVG